MFLLWAISFNYHCLTRNGTFIFHSHYSFSHVEQRVKMMSGKSTVSSQETQDYRINSGVLWDLEINGKNSECWGKESKKRRDEASCCQPLRSASWVDIELESAGGHECLGFLYNCLWIENSPWGGPWVPLPMKLRKRVSLSLVSERENYESLESMLPFENLIKKICKLLSNLANSEMAEPLSAIGTAARTSSCSHTSLALVHRRCPRNNNAATWSRSKSMLTLSCHWAWAC